MAAVWLWHVLLLGLEHTIHYTCTYVDDRNIVLLLLDDRIAALA